MGPPITGGQVRARGELHVETWDLSHCQGILLAVLRQHPRPRSGVEPSQWEERGGDPGKEQQALWAEHRFLAYEWEERASVCVEGAVGGRGGGRSAGADSGPA